MQGNHPKDQHDAKVSRRKFLTRTGAGLVIASIPGKSVWASASGITGSIPASGNTGSGSTNIEVLALRSPGFMKNHVVSNQNGSSGVTNQVGRTMFKAVFGGNLFANGAGATDGSFFNVLKNPGSSSTGMGGTGNINLYLITFYLNAVNSGSHSINYPIVPSGFPSNSALASYLYNLALTNPNGTAYDLDQIIRKNHAGSGAYESIYS